MYSIKYIVPYFGKLPEYFQLWLDTCKMNSDINWLVITDDRSDYRYPNNVEVVYCSFADIKTRFQSLYDFEISLKSAYKLVDYKVAYGEIFQAELTGFDYWGFCDIDLMWGNIRKFITDDILERFPKIGCQGHSTIFKNDPSINAVYRLILDDELSYKQAFSSERVCCTDIGFIRKRFEHLRLPIYDKTVYAGLDAYKPAFYLQAMPSTEAYKNSRQVFLWNGGDLYRYYIDHGNVKEEEYYYIHFFKRPMKNQIQTMDKPILIVPNRYFNYYGKVTADVVNRFGHKSKISFYVRMAFQNRKKISVSKVKDYIRFQIQHNRKNK